ncbi:aminopeptidase P family protein [Paludibacterium yongneupense]|uniref:aminopeptidase P family protein n=1 Tax=Paludibacterium yongneupense TaxID=400061 RepID=UPI000423BC56|nr:aminopeptidase P family protein [Paludibacterium yongneupense]
MFSAEIYQQRRARLAKGDAHGLLLFVGHVDAPMNYLHNCYPFIQDSSFTYFFGLSEPGLCALIDSTSGETTLFGDEADMDDIVWTGELPGLSARALGVGVSRSRPASELADVLRVARKNGTSVHYLNPYRAETVLRLAELLDAAPDAVRAGASPALARAVIALREIKGAEEIAEIERALEVTREMHLEAMRMSQPGVVEREVVGAMEGIMRRRDWQLAYPSIFSRRGEILHNHGHAQILQAGDLVVNDTGASADSGYASDITRTLPVGGRFSPRQRALYDIVLEMQETSIAAMKPGVRYRDIHRQAARLMVERMSSLGFFHGDAEAIVDSGAYAIAFPHGLGHQIGLDVHDMESLGETLVGYEDGDQRSPLFGLAYLRMAKPLRPGMVITVEPGIYFIPALIDAWQAEARHSAFIDYAVFQQYRDFGGIRIEDNVLVTEQGSSVLGTPIPKRAQDVEAAMQGN